MPPPKPKPRVLSASAAKARSMPATYSRNPHPAPSQSPFPTSSTSSPPPPRPPRIRFSLLSFLHKHFTALPRPLQASLRTIGVLAPIVPIGLFLSENVAQVLWINGPSMTPYLNEDYAAMHTKRDVVFVDMHPFRKYWERTARIERGMVVTFRSPGNPNHVAVKRIIGLPGDRITTREPCVKESQIVPFNHVWVEGDAADPHKSLDSNTYGPVSISLISGQVKAVLYPRFRWLDWKGWEEGKVDGVEQEGYREEVRNRVEKAAVKLERERIYGEWV